MFDTISAALEDISAKTYILEDRIADMERFKQKFLSLKSNSHSNSF